MSRDAKSNKLVDEIKHINTVSLDIYSCSKTDKIQKKRMEIVQNSRLTRRKSSDNIHKPHS